MHRTIGTAGRSRRETWQEGRDCVEERRLYRGSENRCSNAPPRDYVHQARALSRYVIIIRGAIICNDDDEVSVRVEGSGGERGRGFSSPERKREADHE